jgi:hypothetical protein
VAYEPKPVIQFSVGPDKVSLQTRRARGVKIAEQGPKSDLYKKVPAIQEAVDNVAQETDDLQTTYEDFLKAAAAFKLARSKYRAGIIRWDGTYDVLVVLAEKHVTSEAEGVTLALEPRAHTHNPVAMPLGMKLTYDYKNDLLRIHVHRAPGMDVICVQVAQHEDGPWTELDGHGAIQEVPHPTAGMHWARAASRTTKSKSDFTTPVGLLIR